MPRFRANSLIRTPVATRANAGAKSRSLQLPALQPAASRHAPKPQKRDCKKRQHIQKKIPSAIARRRGLHSRKRFSTAFGTLHNQPNAPELIAIKFCRSFVFYKAARVIALRRIDYFGQTAAFRLHANRNLQIRRDFPARKRIDDHEECSCADVGMRPESDDARPDLLVLDDGERRTVVRARSPRQKQAKRGHANRRSHRRDGRSNQLSLRYPLISIIVARISMG